jgi:ribosomal protein S18 acetylase RimI-like enzyme
MADVVMDHNFKIRFAEPGDHARIITVIPEWWGGRDISAGLPRMFLVHFWNTSFIIENGTGMIGFLVGFLSQANIFEAYIHFTGIHPNYRHQGLGRLLYKNFFGLCQKYDRKIVRACTSPVNKDSIAFHLKMGFVIEGGDGIVDGVPVTLNYNRPGDPKVLFTKRL